MTTFIGFIVKFRIEILCFSKGENERIIFKKSYALKGRILKITRTGILSDIDKISLKNGVMLKKFCKM